MERDGSLDSTVTSEGCFIRTVRLEGHEGEPGADAPKGRSVADVGSCGRIGGTGFSGAATTD
jgi:hypothetical protein